MNSEFKATLLFPLKAPQASTCRFSWLKDSSQPENRNCTNLCMSKKHQGHHSCLKTVHKQQTTEQYIFSFWALWPHGGAGRASQARELLHAQGRAGATERGPPARPRAVASGPSQRLTSARAGRRPVDRWASAWACVSLGSRRGPRGAGEWDRARRTGSGRGLRRRLPRGRRLLPPCAARSRAERPGPGGAPECGRPEDPPAAGGNPRRVAFPPPPAHPLGRRTRTRPSAWARPRPGRWPRLRPGRPPSVSGAGLVHR